MYCLKSLEVQILNFVISVNGLIIATLIPLLKETYIKFSSDPISRHTSILDPPPPFQQIVKFSVVESEI